MMPSGSKIVTRVAKALKRKSFQVIVFENKFLKIVNLKMNEGIYQISKRFQMC